MNAHTSHPQYTTHSTDLLGNVLGPVLFYVRHIPSLLRPFIDHTILFADDVSFDCSQDSITDITCLTQFNKSAGSVVYRARPQCQHGQALKHRRQEVTFNGYNRHTLTQVLSSEHTLSRSHH